jgi:hypothetical protein
MVDLATHRIVDMIASREYTDVKEWLQAYPNLRVVSRDGSITYHNAITDAHPDAIQISDRFHLLKNLTAYGQEFLKKELQSHITISATANAPQGIFEPISKANENRKLTLKEKYDQIERLAELGCTKSGICKSLNMDIRVYDKLVSTPPEDVDALFQTRLMLTHEEKVQQKQKSVDEIRELKKHGFSNREISRRTGLSAKTIQRYLEENFNPVHAAYSKKKVGILTPYTAEINRMLELGMMGIRIEDVIRKKGYTASSSSVRHYISDWKRRRKHTFGHDRSSTEATETLERKNVFKLLYHPLEEVKSITRAQFDAMCGEHPCFEKMHSIIWDFKLLLATKNVVGLDSWMTKAKALDIREICSFVDGLTRDLDAVRNAIVSSYSNGLAEGSVNKLKVIKRIMYGRCNFKMLKTKTLCLESMRHFN